LYARHIVWRKGVFRVDYRQCRCSPPFASLRLCRTSVFMTLWHTHTSIHDITTKYPKPAELTIWLVIQKV
jgi:hypothetical protein